MHSRHCRSSRSSFRPFATHSRKNRAPATDSRRCAQVLRFSLRGFRSGDLASLLLRLAFGLAGAIPLALPPVETSAVHTQSSGQLADVITELHPPDSPLLKFLGVPQLLRHTHSPFAEKCRTPLCLNLGAQSRNHCYKFDYSGIFDRREIGCKWLILMVGGRGFEPPTPGPEPDARRFWRLLKL